MKSLLLTLGHNSSAILIEDDKLLWGYETERITRVKSDSRFPHRVLEEMFAKNRFQIDDVDIIYASHWNPHGILGNMSAKHWAPEVLDGKPIRSYDPDFTHHDGHAFAALNFAGVGYNENWNVLIVDGFGNYGEHFSYYDVSPTGQPVLKQRFRGYGTSLGLWYQYATAFLGLKMNEDEYKLLGYESKVHQVLTPDEVLDLESLAEKEVVNWYDRVDKSGIYKQDDPLFNLNALELTKQEIFRKLNGVWGLFQYYDEPTGFNKRVIVSHYVQQVLEGVIATYVKVQNPKNLIVAGGVFYNVKLNNVLLNMLPGNLCVHPLAGDQGNAIGMYARDNPLFKFPRDLNWGHRSLYIDGKVDGMMVAGEEHTFFDRVYNELLINQMVNVVRGSMEFGPRAMCNTSTLALPTLENVAKINEYNDRTTIMPMAPVVTRQFYEANFKNYDRVWNSEKFMICALNYLHMDDKTLGAANEYQRVGPKGMQSYYTGRPQVVDRANDPELWELLNEFGGILINTSFNFHGVPICYDMTSVVDSHRAMQQRGSNLRTIVYQNG